MLRPICSKVRLFENLPLHEQLPMNNTITPERRRALVTGASSGIGRAIALEFARAGADVIVHCRASQDLAERTVRDCRSYGVRSARLTADLADPQQIGTLVDRAWSLWHGLELVVNNAGVDLLTGPNARLSYAEKLQCLLDVDVRGTVLLCQAVGPRLQAAGRGVILNMGWDQADRGMEGASGELFATAKNALMGFSRSLAVSLAPQVRVHCLAPGWIQTAWGEQAPEHWQNRVLAETPLRRWGTPTDLAYLARFLCCDEAGYLTGQVLNANGGAVR